MWGMSRRRTRPSGAAARRPRVPSIGEKNPSPSNLLPPRSSHRARSKGEGSYISPGASEDELQRELDFAGGERLRGAAERRLGHVAVRALQVDAVEDVEHFRAELQLRRAGHAEVLEEGQVGRGQARAAIGV